MAEEPTVHHMVVDSGGFILNAPIREIGKNIYTIPEVISESCDKGTRRRLQMAPYQLNYKTPSAEAVVHISDIAKKTGDYRHLSATDIRVLALTYMLAKEHGKLDVNKEEEKGGDDKEETIEEDVDVVLLVEDEEEDAEIEESAEESTEEDAAEVEENAGEDMGEDADVVQGEDEEEDAGEDKGEDADDDDGDGEWITPSNIQAVKKKMGLGCVMTDKANVSVACLTTDFAMQNVLVHMGLNVVSVDGRLIKQARTYVLRCFACMKITHNMTKTFCPNCGNKTLKRVAVFRDEDGNMQLYISKKPLNTRGQKFPLPLPEGGKHANNPQLCEDQPTPQQRMTRKAKEMMDVFDPDYVASSSPFTVNDISSRASKMGISKSYDFRKGAYWNRRNPNEARKRSGKKK